MREIPRREALRRIGLLVGGALSASTASALLAGCRADPATDYAYRVLDRRQQPLVGTLVDLILPETDTPGARAAGVPAFIDTLLAAWMDDAERDRFLAGLADVDARAEAAHGARFVDLDAAQQTALLAALDAEAYASDEPPAEAAADEAAAASAQSGTDAMADAAEQAVPAEPAAEEAPPHFFATLKELTLVGYYTSEIGATQELRWSSAPGRYDADVPFSEVRPDLGLIAMPQDHTHAPAPPSDTAAPPEAPSIRADDVFDAIVVGSGITGGWAAKELTEKGFRTLVLERGRPVTHGASYVTEHRAPWEAPFRGRGDRQAYAAEKPMQSQIGPFNEHAAHWYINDRENPYVAGRDPVLWIRGDHVGGRSLMWGRHCYRWSDLDFTANAREGVEIDWPIRYADLAPWYDYVEDYVGISGERLGLAHLPDGPFLPPMPLTAVEQHVRVGIQTHFPGRTLTVGRVATLTREHRGRPACHYCGPCDRGCSTGSYFSSLSVTLPAAEATGRLTLRPNALVHSLVYDEGTDRVTGVRVIDRETKDEVVYRGRLVFLCASALASTQVLLNTRTPRFPDGLANSSGTLGRYLMDHHMKVGAEADFEGFEDRYYVGNRPTGTYVPRFRNLDAASRHPAFRRGYAFEGGTWRDGWERGAYGPGFGADLKNQLREPGMWKLFLSGFGEILPRADNYVELDPAVTDAWGIPALRIHASLGDDERAMRDDMAASAAEMLEAAGGTNVFSFDDSYAFGEGIHEMGTARMGRDPRTSVLNGWNQAHDVPNLFVTDGACMTSSACQNPSITYMALTARAVDYAVDQIRRGDLRI